MQFVTQEKSLPTQQLHAWMLQKHWPLRIPKAALRNCWREVMALCPQRLTPTLMSLMHGLAETANSSPQKSLSGTRRGPVKLSSRRLRDIQRLYSATDSRTGNTDRWSSWHWWRKTLSHEHLSKILYHHLPITTTDQQHKDAKIQHKNRCRFNTLFNINRQINRQNTYSTCSANFCWSVCNIVSSL